MRYGYKIIHEPDDDYSILRDDHTNVLSATMNIVQWQLCRQDTHMKGFFSRAEIINAETGRVVYRVTPDQEYTELEKERDSNREEWDKVMNQLPKLATNNPEYKKAYAKLSPVLNKYKEIDKRIIKDQAERIKEIIKGL